MEIFVIGKYLQILENLNLCQKKEEKKSQKTIDLKKTTTDFVMHSELYCILGILSFFFPCRNNQHKHFVNSRIEKWNVKVMLLFVTAKVQKLFFNLQRLEIIFMGSWLWAKVIQI